MGDLPDVYDRDLGRIDDFRMTVGMGLLGDANGTDGARNTLANATPLQFRTGSSGLPWLGITGIDPLDADRPELRYILLHEFGHALGFTPGATVFSQYVVTTGAGSTAGKGFVGQHALQAYREIFNNASATSVPLETSGGAGTAGAHWKESVLGTELMTGYVDPVMQLSRITVGAMEDFGYKVNYAAADRYIPAAALQAGGQVAGAASGLNAAAAFIRLAADRVSFDRLVARPAGPANTAVATNGGQAAASAAAQTPVEQPSRRAGLAVNASPRAAAVARAVFGSWRSERVTAQLS